MAHTASALVNTVYGNHRVNHIRITLGADSATADVETGLTYVDSVLVQPLFGCVQPAADLNKTNAGSSVNGTVAIRSATSGASCLVVAYGQ